jgi:hypothetical protein
LETSQVAIVISPTSVLVIFVRLLRRIVDLTVYDTEESY